MTKKFMVDKYSLLINPKAWDQLVEYENDKIRGMEASLAIIDEDCPDFDLTMPCGEYGDEG
jgi:hypothetical protein